MLAVTEADNERDVEAEANGIVTTTPEPTPSNSVLAFQQVPRKLSWTIRAFFMAPPIAACLWYYVAGEEFAEDNIWKEKYFDSAIGVDAYLIDFCLYELRAYRLAERVSKFIYKNYHADKKALSFWRDNFLQLIKNSPLAIVAAVSAYPYKYITEQEVGQKLTKTAFAIITAPIAWLTFFSKYTLFHQSLLELIDIWLDVLRNPKTPVLFKILQIAFSLILGIVGTTYVFFPANDSYADIGANSIAAIMLGTCALLPTAFLTGTSLTNIITAMVKTGKKSFSSLPSLHCPSPIEIIKGAANIFVTLLKQIIFIALALPPAMANADLIQNSLKDHAPWMPMLARYLLFIAPVLILSAITKRDSLPVIADAISKKAPKPKCLFFSRGKEPNASDQPRDDSPLLNPEGDEKNEDSVGAELELSAGQSRTE